LSAAHRRALLTLLRERRDTVDAELIRRELPDIRADLAELLP